MSPHRDRSDRATPALARGAAERVHAWLLTGPVGHLYAILADIGEMGARQLAASVRRRARR